MSDICKYYKPYMDTLKQLCKRFYELEGCGAGGPLHILLDDDNYDIGSVQFCIDYCFEDLRRKEPNYPAHVNLMGIAICNEYANMSLEERAIFDAYLIGYEINKYKCRGDCESCSYLGLDSLYHDMKEAEQLT